MQPNIETMSVVELKALCFDQLAQIEQCQLNVRALNQKIAEKQKQASNVERPLELADK